MDVKLVVNTNINQILTLRKCIYYTTRTDRAVGRVQVINSVQALVSGIVVTLKCRVINFIQEITQIHFILTLNVWSNIQIIRI